MYEQSACAACVTTAWCCSLCARLDADCWRADSTYFCVSCTPCELSTFVDLQALYGKQLCEVFEQFLGPGTGIPAGKYNSLRTVIECTLHLQKLSKQRDPISTELHKDMRRLVDLMQRQWTDTNGVGQPRLPTGLHTIEHLVDAARVVGVFGMRSEGGEHLHPFHRKEWFNTTTQLGPCSFPNRVGWTSKEYEHPRWDSNFPENEDTPDGHYLMHSNQLLPLCAAYMDSEQALSNIPQPSPLSKEGWQQLAKCAQKYLIGQLFQPSRHDDD